MEKLFNNSDIPLAAKLIPSDLDEFAGQLHLVGPDSVIRKLIEQDRLISCVFYGPPGTGKSALARIIAKRTKSDFIRLNAVTATIDDIRKAVKRAYENRNVGVKTVLFVDEIHRFNKAQQDALLPPLEEGIITLIGATTKNPFFSLTPPLRSRVLLFEFKKLSEEDLKKVLELAEKKTGIKISSDGKKYLINMVDGDARRMLNIIDATVSLKAKDIITKDDLTRVIKEQWILYDRDEDYHYDVISAFIKSIRGSDPDAALYWLAVMLEGGEDPLFIARRLIILASEDIGLADSFALVLANSAYEAVDNIGMPEARIILAHATLYLSIQPKSNSSYLAIENALSYVKNNPLMDVPTYLRASHPDKKKYKYPHNYGGHFVRQKYMEKNISFYTPTEMGREKELKKIYDRLKEIKDGENNSGNVKK